MNRYRMAVRDLLLRAAEHEGGTALSPAEVVLETPPRGELGDIAFPMFPFARLFRRPPQEIALRFAGRLNGEAGGGGSELASFSAQGPYLNVRLNRPRVITEVLDEVRSRAGAYGRGDGLEGQKIIVEFSSPNTNKPLHLGHLRNDAIGMSVSALLETQGAEVRRMNLVNDRGVHICKSMLAYRKSGDLTDPAHGGIKGDRLVGDFYVRYAELEKADPAVEEEVRQMLKAWEQGDPETRELWKRMNSWALEGIFATYRRTGVRFDKVEYESNNYLLGREEVLKGLAQGIFQKDQDGSIWVDLSGQELDRKVLLRSDGTSLYVTQDIGTAVQRHRDWSFDRLIYVVGNEQRYHFQVLFKVLKLLGHSWSASLHHLAYGMVNLPEGKMKSREGTVVDADDLLDDLKNLAEQEIRDKGRELEIQDLAGTSEGIALGALNYYLLQASPFKDILFNPRESISFNGNTGPYLQYTGARISSMQRKFQERKERFKEGVFSAGLLKEEEEWELVKNLAAFPDTVAQCAGELNPSFLAAHLFELAKLFSRYYHDQPVLHNPDPHLVVSRIHLAEGVLQVLKNGLPLLGVPFLDRM